MLWYQSSSVGMSPKDRSVGAGIKTPEFMLKQVPFLTPGSPISTHIMSREIERDPEKYKARKTAYCLLTIREKEKKEMGWFFRERRGPAWKQGWTDQTLASISPPPLPLLAIFLIIFILLSASSYANYKNHMQQTMINFKLLLLFLPLLLILLAAFISKCESFMFPKTKAEYGSVDRNWNMPWGLAVLVVVLLVMVSYRSTFQSMWSPIVWRSA